jgi:cytochrome c553
VPAPYAGKTNPFTGDAEAIRVGGEIYASKCAKCHGDSGAGDGTVAPKLDLKPTDFTLKDHMDAMKDDYLFWRSSEGGDMEPFHSKMPAWKDKLTQDERWKALAFVRTLAGAKSREGEEHAHEHEHGEGHEHEPAQEPPAATQYTCPMHPEVLQPGPGRCPKCGMNLELKK